MDQFIKIKFVIIGENYLVYFFNKIIKKIIIHKSLNQSDSIIVQFLFKIKKKKIGYKDIKLHLHFFQKLDIFGLFVSNLSYITSNKLINGFLIV